jgi:hypothetical protein
MRLAVPALAASFCYVSRRQFQDATFYRNWAMELLAPFIEDKDRTTDFESTSGLSRIDGENSHRLA